MWESVRSLFPKTIGVVSCNAIVNCQAAKLLTIWFREMDPSPVWDGGCAWPGSGCSGARGQESGRKRKRRTGPEEWLV